VKATILDGSAGSSTRKDLGLHRRIGPRQLGRKGRQRTPALGVIAVFRAQVGLHNRLPCRPGLRLFSRPNQVIGHLPKSLALGFHDQLVFTSEMFIKASVSQAGVPHHG